MPIHEPLVPNKGFTSLQLHVLDQFAHAAVLKRLLLNRHSTHNYLPMVERTLRSRYDDCVNEGVASTAIEIQERLADSVK